MARTRPVFLEHEVEPQWGDAFRILYTFATKKANPTYESFIQMLALVIDKQPEFHDGDLLHFIESHKELSVEVQDSARSVQRKDVVTIRGKLIRMERLVHFIGLWSAVEGYTAYFDADWWKPYDLPLHHVFYTVKMLVRSFSDQFKRILKFESYEAGEAIMRCIERLSRQSLINRLPPVKKIFPKYNDDPLNEPLDFKTVIRTLNKIHKLRSYRCLHPMQRAAMHHRHAEYEQYLEKQGRPSVREIVGGEAFSMMPEVNGLGDDDNADVVRFLGSAIFHTAAGLRVLQMHHNPSDDQMTAIHNAIRAIKTNEESGGQYEIIKVAGQAWKENFKSLLRWAQQTSGRGDGYRLTTHELREINALLFRDSDRVTQDGYMVIAHACYDHIVANGFVGASPPCRLFAALFLALNQMQPIPRDMPGTTSLTRLREVFKSNFPFEHLRHIDEEISHHTVGEHGQYTPMGELMATDKSLFDIAWDATRELAPDGVVNHFETSWNAYFWSAPILASMLYAKPSNLVDIHQAVVHFDYAMLALSASTIFRADGKMSDIAGAMWPSTIVRGFDLKGQKSMFGARESMLVSKMFSWYIYGLLMHLVKQTRYSDNLDLQKIMLECLEKDWTVFDLIRLVEYKGVIPGVVVATPGKEKSSKARPLLPRGWGMKTVRITAERVLKLVFISLVEQARKELASETPNLMAFYKLYGAATALMSSTRFDQLYEEHSWVKIHMDDIASILETVNQAPEMKRMWMNQKQMVSDHQFALQSHGLKFCHNVYPGINATTHSDSTKPFVASGVREFKHVFISSHAHKMFDLMIYATRIHSIFRRPDFLVLHMDSTIIPMIKAYGSAVARGIEKFHLPGDLQGSVSKMAIDAWKHTKGATYDPRKGAAIFQPSPAFHAPAHVNEYYGPMQMINAPKVHMGHVRPIRTTADHGELQNTQHRISDWSDYAPNMMKNYFWHRQGKMHVIDLTTGELKLEENNFQDVDFANGSGITPVSFNKTPANQNSTRTFVDVEFDEPFIFESSLDREIAQTRVTRFPYKIDFRSINATPDDFLCILLKKAKQAWHRANNQKIGMSYRMFNAYIRDAFSIVRSDGTKRWIDSSLPIDYKILRDRVLPKEFYESHGLFMMVPDCVMQVIERYMPTKDQRDYFVQCHCFASRSYLPLSTNNAIETLTDNGVPELFLNDYANNVVPVTQLLSDGDMDDQPIEVIPRTAYNLARISECSGMILLQGFNPSAFVHFSKLSLNAVSSRIHEV